MAWPLGPCLDGHTQSGGKFQTSEDCMSKGHIVKTSNSEVVFQPFQSSICNRPINSTTFSVNASKCIDYARNGSKWFIRTEREYFKQQGSICQCSPCLRNLIKILKIIQAGQVISLGYRELERNRPLQTCHGIPKS